MNVDMRFVGDKEIQDFLNQIPKKITNQLTISTAKQVLKKWTIADARRRVKAMGLYKTGTLYRSLKVWTWKKGVLAGSQRKMSTKKKIKDDAYYAYFIEHGHKDRSGNFIPARPFFRPAWNATKEKVLKEMQTTFWKVVENYARRKKWI